MKKTASSLSTDRIPKDISLTLAEIRARRTALDLKSPDWPCMQVHNAAEMGFQEHILADVDTLLSIIDSFQVGQPSTPSVAEGAGDLPGLDVFARMIVKRISDAAIELAFMRHSLTSDEVIVDDDADIQARVDADERLCEEVKEDTFDCLTGDETGCNEPEDLNETNCELIWLKTQLTKSSEASHNPEDGVASSVQHESESESSVSGEIEDAND